MSQLQNTFFCCFNTFSLWNNFLMTSVSLQSFNCSGLALCFCLPIKVHWNGIWYRNLSPLVSNKVSITSEGDQFHSFYTNLSFSLSLSPSLSLTLSLSLSLSRMPWHILTLSLILLLIVKQRIFFLCPTFPFEMANYLAWLQLRAFLFENESVTFRYLIIGDNDIEVGRETKRLERVSPSFIQKN